MQEELSPEQKKKLERYASLHDDLPMGMMEEVDSLHEKISEVTDIREELSDIADKLTTPALQNVVVTNKVEVSNFPDFPKTVSITEPSWFSWKGIKEHLSSIAQDIKDTVFSVEVKNPQKEVMLVDEDGNPINLKHFGKSETKYVGGGGGSGRTLEMEEHLKKMVGEYTVLLDDVTTTGMTYVGKAVIGTATSASFWQIKRLDETGSPVTLTVKWADNAASFNKIWDNRASLSYN